MQLCEEDTKICYVSGCEAGAHPGQVTAPSQGTHTHSHRRADSASSSSKQDGDLLAAILNMGSRKITDQSGPVSTPNGMNSAADRLRIIKGLGNLEFPLRPCSQMTDYTCFGSVLLYDLYRYKDLRASHVILVVVQLRGHQACRR